MANSSIVSEIRSNFHRIYYEKIAPVMVKYEKERKSKLFIISLLEIILLIAAGFIFHLIYPVITRSADNTGDICILILIPGILFLFTLIGIPLSKNDSFVNKLKKECMKDIMPAFGNLKWGNYDEFSGNGQYDIDKSKLFQDFNLHTEDDMFEGSFEDIKCTISETSLKRETGRAGHRKRSCVFSGIIISYTTNKVINSQTIITTKYATSAKNNNGFIFTFWAMLSFTFIGIIFKSAVFATITGILTILLACTIFKRKYDQNIEGLAEIKFTDIEISKKYRIYSSDEEESRSLITPEFIKNFKLIQKTFRTGEIKCSFFENIIMIAIPSQKNWFEIGNLFTPLNSPKQLNKFFNELISILSIIDYFKLNETIDSKIKQELPNDQNNN